MTDDRIAIPGSAVTRSPGVERMRTADPNQIIEPTIVVRRPADLNAVVDFARLQGLQILEESAAKRMVRVRGSIQQMNAAFGIDLAHYSAPDGTGFLSYDGSLTATALAAPAILAVLGLHQQPVARRR